MSPWAARKRSAVAQSPEEILDAGDHAGEGLAQAGDEFGRERHRGLAGDVVEDDVAQGGADRLEGAAEPGENPFVFRGFQVEGRGEEQALAACVEDEAGLRGGVGDRGGGDGAVDAAGVDAGVEDGAEHGGAVGEVDGEAFAGGAEEGEAVAAVGEDPGGVAGEAGEVGGAVGGERRDESGRKSEDLPVGHDPPLSAW